MAVEVVAILPRALGAWQPWNYSNYVAMGRAHYIVRKPVTVAIALAILIVADYIFVARGFSMRTPSMNCWIQNNDKLE